MTTTEIRARLIHALTAYDRRQSKRADHNPYALGLYFARVDDVMADIAAGAPVDQALAAGFNGPLHKAVAKALGVAVVADHSRAWHYVPVSERKGT